jgi:phage tail sheath protein FI
MAINLISPGIKITETDQVASVPASGPTVAGTVGRFRWGPISKPTLVTSENELVSQFGSPNATNVVDFLVSANYLAYSSNLYVVRVANTALNATASNTTADTANSGTGLLIENDDVYDNTYSNGSADDGPWVAKYAGALGNSIKVSTCPSATAWESTLSGTWTVAAGGTTVSGSGGAANTQVTVGDIVILGGRSLKVASVTNADFFTLQSSHLTGATGATVTRRWEYFDSFDVEPGTSTFAGERGGVNDEMHIAIVDEDGLITGTKDTLLEKFQAVSKGSDAKGETGGSNYYKDIINTRSRYIRWLDHDTLGTNWGTSVTNKTFTAVNAPINYSLAGGSDGSAITDANKISGYNLYTNKANINISLIPMGVASATVINSVIADIAERRKDVVVVFSPESDDVVNNVGDEATDVNAFANSVTRSTYAFMDGNWKYQYDKYNDAFVYVPCNADTAGCMARTDAESAPWFSPAGFAKGRILNTVKLAWNPNEAERDLLYKNAVNPIFTQPGRGVVLFGDKTFTTKTGSFSRINVRRLFIEIQKGIGAFAEDLLFEQNDDATRALFVNTVEPYLRDIQGQRGMTDFRVICDETNNPENVVNANEFIADIYVRPIASINFIQLNFVSVRGASAFAELG